MGDKGACRCIIGRERFPATLSYRRYPLTSRLFRRFDRRYIACYQGVGVTFFHIRGYLALRRFAIKYPTVSLSIHPQTVMRVTVKQTVMTTARILSLIYSVRSPYSLPLHFETGLYLW